MAAASGVVRKWITDATASVVTHFAGSASGMAARFAGVSMVPGSTALARPPKGAISRASDSTMRSTPALVAAYPPTPASPNRAAGDDTATSTPPRARSNRRGHPREKREGGGGVGFGGGGQSGAGGAAEGPPREPP